MIDTARMILKSEVLRSRGKNNTLHDIDDGADLLHNAAREIEKLRETVNDLMFLAEAEHVCLISWNGSGSGANYDGIMERSRQAVTP